MDAAFNRLLAERLFPILVEQAETNDSARKAKLEEKCKRLQSLVRKCCSRASRSDSAWTSFSRWRREDP